MTQDNDIDDDKKSPNEKAAQTYKLYDKGKNPVKVSIDLNIAVKYANPKKEPN